MKLILSTAALALLPLQDQEGGPAPAEAAPVPAAGVGEEGSQFGAPLVVGGARIPDLQIKRYLCYGPGRMALEGGKIRVLTAREREFREAEGANLDMYTMTPEAYEKARQRQVKDFEARYPSLELDTEIGRAYKSVEWYERQLRTTLEFDAMFFPEDPRDWPDVTKEAIHQGVAEGQQPGQPFIDLVADAIENYDRRVAWAAENETDVVPEDEMFMGLLRDYVIQSLMGFVQIYKASDGIPLDQVMVMDGGEWVEVFPTEEVYASIEAILDPKDLPDTKGFLALMRAAELRLAEEGFLLSQEEFDALFTDLRDKLSGGMFNMDFLAMEGHRFPSLEHYKRHLWLIESFRKRSQSQIWQDESGAIAPALQEHLPLANEIMGLGKVDAEVLLVSARDFLHDEWKKDGWAWAEKEAARIKGEIDAHLDRIVAFDQKRLEAAQAGVNLEEEEPLAFERFWAQMLDLHSEFWDPPMPVSGKQPPMMGMKLKGRFGLQTRNDLEQDLEESAFTHLVSGRSLADTIFFDMEPGSVAGPFEGPQGYYIVYLKQRTRATHPLRMSEPRHFEYLREDWLRRAFIAYAHEALAQVGSSGL